MSLENRTLDAYPTLYQYTVCPFCCKVRAILDYKGIPYKKVEVHPLNKKQIAFSKSYRKVPIFVDADGTQVNDSTAIMRYIEEKYPEYSLQEKEVEEQKVESWLVEWGDSTLVRAIPPLIYDKFSSSIRSFNYITNAGEFSRLQRFFIKYSGAFIMTMVARKSAKSQGIEEPGAHFESLLETWGDALKDQAFLSGEKPNMADMCLYGILSSIEELPAFRFVKNNHIVYRWYENVREKIQQEHQEKVIEKEFVEV